MYERYSWCANLHHGTRWSWEERTSKPTETKLRNSRLWCSPRQARPADSCGGWGWRETRA